MKLCLVFLAIITWNVLVIDARTLSASAPSLGSFTVDGARHASVASGGTVLKKLAANPSQVANGSRMAYGQRASPGQFPFATYVTDNTRACSGSLIAPRVVLTAAHCVTDENTGGFLDLPNYVFTVGSLDDTVNPTNSLKVKAQCLL